jgi:heat shock protein 5
LLTRCSCLLFIVRRFEDKEVQRDKKLVSYDIVDKATKPYIKVKVNGEEKVREV